MSACPYCSSSHLAEISPEQGASDDLEAQIGQLLIDGARLACPPRIERSRGN
jgi:hypothetical protein